MEYELREDNVARFATKPKVGGARFPNGHATNAWLATTGLETVYTAGAYGGQVDSIRILNDENATKVIHLYIKDGADYREIGAYLIPANAGTNGSTIAFDPLSITVSAHLPINSQGKRYIDLPPNAEIVAGILAAPASGKTVSVCANGADYAAG